MNTVQRVYELIAARDMTLYQLSQRSGIPYNTFKRTEKRGGELSVDTLHRICDALGITMSDFFREPGERLHTG